jgi:hypothetical protein
MANYTARARSNYFRVKNEERFRTFCGRYELDVIDRKKDDTKLFCVLMYDGLPPGGYYDDEGDWVEIDFIQELSEQLAEGEVAVVMEIADQMIWSLYGYACAVNSQGKVVELRLEDIYRLAKQTFGVEPSEANSQAGT